MKTSRHPLDPLSPQEIKAASAAVRQSFGDKLPSLKACKFQSITLKEPPRAQVIRYLGLATSPEAIGNVAPDHSVHIPRKAEATLIDALSGEVYEVSVGLDSHPATVEKVTKLPAGVQPGITNEVRFALLLRVTADTFAGAHRRRSDRASRPSRPAAVRRRRCVYICLTGGS